MSIIYRKATIEELEELFDLTVEFTKYNAKMSGDQDYFFKGNWEKYFREEIKESLSDNNSLYLVAQDDISNKLVGYQLSKFHEQQFYYSIDELFVLDKYRGQGIARVLLEKGVEFGKTFGCDIRVEVYLWNRDTIEYYKKRGFEESALILELKGNIN